MVCPPMTGFVLAGGKSSRMGREKALLRIGQSTLIEVVIRRLRTCVQHLVVIGNAQNVSGLEGVSDVTVLTDLKPAYGPLMGIYTGLMSTTTPLNLFVSCDMPWLDGRLIERLASAWCEQVESVASLHPLEGVQPFPLLCHVNACRTVGALLDQGERSLKALLSRPGARLVRIEEPELWRAFTNVNTVADYAQLCDETPVPS